MVQLVDPADLLIADTATILGVGGKATRGLRLRPLVDTWRAGCVAKGYGSKSDILAYLTTPPQARLVLEARTL